jgi:SdrD B-like domain
MDDRKLEQTNRAIFQTLEPRRLLASVISGTVFSETDADGRREKNESGLADQRVYVDLNFDGKRQSSEPSVLTDAKGEYRFTLQNAGVYRVRPAVTGGHRQTSPGQLFYDIAANGNDFHVANDFGMTVTAVVRGAVFDDANGDGVKQSGEKGIAGIRVYVDKNNDGSFDSETEKSRITTSSGAFRFAGLAARKYSIRIETPAGMDVTTPSRGFVIVQLKRAQSLSNRLVGLA